MHSTSTRMAVGLSTPTPRLPFIFKIFLIFFSPNREDNFGGGRGEPGVIKTGGEHTHSRPTRNVLVLLFWAPLFCTAILFDLGWLILDRVLLGLQRLFYSMLTSEGLHDGLWFSSDSVLSKRTTATKMLLLRKRESCRSNSAALLHYCIPKSFNN